MNKKAQSQPATVKVITTNHLFLKIGHNLSAQELFPNTHNMFTHISLMQLARDDYSTLTLFLKNVFVFFKFPYHQ